MIARALLCALLVFGLDSVGFSGPETPAPGGYRAVVVEFPPDRIPQFLWSRELVWLHNIGVHAVAAPHASAEFQALAHQSGIEIVQPELQAVRVSATDPAALEKSRSAIHARKQALWTNVESEASPVFHKGAVSFAGEETRATQALRREAAVADYWAPVLDSLERSEAAHIAGLALAEQRFATSGMATKASAIDAVNTGSRPWHGALTAALPSFGRKVQIPNVTIPPHDALMIPVDVAFNDPRFCRFCSGMANSERLLYATAELTAIEYENGILSFDFYAPAEGVAVLQLERQPEGPMIAGGHPVSFDWDPEMKRARLPIPAGSGEGRHTRIAIAMSAPEDVAGFGDTHVLITGRVNRVATEYSPPEIAARSRLIVPEGWKLTSEAKPPEVIYGIDVPELPHGSKEELRIEIDGASVSHRIMQLLRPVSVHVAEAMAVHFGEAAEVVSDPPWVNIEAANGRNITLQIRNNAPEIQTFHISAEGEGVDFSPAAADLAIGAASEREIALRVFLLRPAAGPRNAVIHLTGAATYDLPLRLVVLPRGAALRYEADLLGIGTPQHVWENNRLRAVFSRADGGRWIELYWKPSGKSLLNAEGVPMDRPARIELSGDELTIDGAVALPHGGRVGNVEWKAVTAAGAVRYRVTETISAR